MRLVLFTFILPTTLVLIPVTSLLAHSPVFPEENHDPSDAYEIDDPAESWAINTRLEHQENFAVALVLLEG